MEIEKVEDEFGRVEEVRSGEDGTLTAVHTSGDQIGGVILAPTVGNVSSDKQLVAGVDDADGDKLSVHPKLENDVDLASNLAGKEVVHSQGEATDINLAKHFSCHNTPTEIISESEDSASTCSESASESNTHLANQAYQLCSRPFVMLETISPWKLGQLLDCLDRDEAPTTNEVEVKFELVNTGGNKVIEPELEQKIFETNPGQCKAAFPCYLCTQKFVNVAQVLSHGLDAHKQQLAEEKIMDLATGCPNCGLKYHHGDTLQKHIQLCQAKRQSEKRLHANSRQGNSNQTLSTAAKTLWKTRRQRLIKSKRPTCWLCGKKFRTWKLMYWHKKNVHCDSNESIELPKTTPMKEDEDFTIHTCHKCNKTFSSEHDLTSHHSECSDGLCYPCTECPREFAQLTGLRKHLTCIHNIYGSDQVLTSKPRSQMKVVDPICFACGIGFKTWDKAYKHMATCNYRSNVDKDDTSAAHACDKCGKVFSSKGNLVRHVRISHSNSHTRDRRSKFSSRLIVKNVSVDKPSNRLCYPCTKCPRDFIAPSYLKKHLSLIHNISPSHQVIASKPRNQMNNMTPACFTCGKVFKYWSHVYSHMRSVHSDSTSPHSSKTTTKLKDDVSAVVHACGTCGKVFSSKGNRMRHEQISHSKSKAVKSRFKPCERNPQRSSSNLLDATSRLSGMCYPCPECPREFSKIFSLKKHLTSIHKIPKHKQLIKPKPRNQMKILKPVCFQCGKHFVDWKGVYSHMRIFHSTSEGPDKGSSASCVDKNNIVDTHSCGQCGRIFTSKGNLVRHVRISHSHNQAQKRRYKLSSKNAGQRFHALCYQCTECPREFTKISNLRSHLTSTHKIPKPKQVIKSKPLNQMKALKPVCFMCGKQFVSWRGATTHMRIFHLASRTSKNDSSALLVDRKNIPEGYTCGECDKTFTSNGNLLRHMGASHSKGFARVTLRLDHQIKQAQDANSLLYSCSICQKSCRWKHGIIRHLRLVHKLSTNVCTKIKVLTANRKKANTLPICSLCKITFISWKKLYDHMKQHSRNTQSAVKSHHCTRCGLSFASSKLCQKHLSVCRPATSNPMPDAEFKGPAKTTKGKKQVSSKSIWPCHLCGKIVTHTGVWSHLSLVHSTHPDVIPIRSVEDDAIFHIPPTCVYCGITTDAYISLYQHMKLCNEAKLWQEKGAASKFKCQSCHLLFQDIKQFQFHKKWFHGPLTSTEKVGFSEDLVYPCNICGRVMLSLSSLENHMRGVHFIKCTKETTIEGVPKSQAVFSAPHCKMCKKDFSKWRGLYIHMRKHHGSTGKTTPELDLLCRHCGLTFRNKDRLNNHKRHCGKNLKPYNISLKPHIGKATANQLPPPQSSLTEKSNCEHRITCDFCEKEFVEENVWFQHLSLIHRMTSNKCQEMRNTLREKRSTLSAEKFSDLLLPSSGDSSTLNVDRISSPNNAKTLSPDQLRHSCRECDFSTKYINNLLRHYANIHGLKLTRESILPSQLCSTAEEKLAVETPKNPPQSAQQDSVASNVCNTSSDEDEWADLPTDVGTSSSSDSSSESDEDDIYKMDPSYANHQQVSSSTSSCSSDEDVNADAAQVSSALCDVEVANHQSDESGVVGLNADIFLTGNDCVINTSDLQLMNGNDCTKSTSPKLTAKTVVDHSFNQPLNRSPPPTSSVHDDCVSVKKVDHVDSYKAQFVQEKVIDVTNFAIVETITEDHFGNQTPNTNSPTGQDVDRRNLNSASVVSQTRNPPVAVLRPFSGIPETTDSILGKTTSSSSNFPVSQPSNVRKGKIKDSQHMTKRVGVSDSSHIAERPQNLPDNKNRQTLSRDESNVISFPIFLVNKTDFIVPCTVQNVHIYRRISLVSSNGKMLWHFDHWYQKFNRCQWVVIALLPKPLLYLDQLDRLMKWIIENKIASFPYSLKQIPLVCSRDWEIEPLVKIVSGYDTITFSAICYLCGRLTIGTQEIKIHSSKEHSICHWCDQVCSVHNFHVCNPTKAQNKGNGMKQIAFVKLSSPSSVNCTVVYVNVQLVLAKSSSDTIGAKPVLTCATDPQLQKPMASNMNKANFHMDLAKKHMASTCVSVVRMHSADIGGLQIRKHGQHSRNRRPVQDDSGTATYATCQDTVGRIMSSGRASNIKTSHSLRAKPSHSDQQVMEFYKMNKSSKPYKCKFCSADFLLWVEMTHHLQMSHKKCTLCELQFSGRKERGDHITKDHNQFICLACDHTCASNVDIRTHIIQTHVNIHTGLFHCSQCGDTDIDPDAIVAHLEEHDCDSNQQCSLCHQRLPPARQEQLKHFVIHSFEERMQYQCVSCEQAFLEPWALRHHINVVAHSRSCQICLLTSTTEDTVCACIGNPSAGIHALVMKNISQSDKKPPVCTLCWSSIETNLDLRLHCDTEHKQCSFQCETCGQRFEFEHQKKFHMAKHRRPLQSLKLTLCTGCMRVESKGVKQGGRVDCQLTETCQWCRCSITYTRSTTTPAPSTTATPVMSSDMFARSAVSMTDESPNDNKRSPSPELKVQSSISMANTSHSISWFTSSSDSSDSDYDDKLVIVRQDTSSSHSPVSNKVTSSAPSRSIFNCSRCSFSCKFRAALNKHIQKKHGLN